MTVKGVPEHSPPIHLRNLGFHHCVKGARLLD
jgi:hypothetical protein